MFWGDAVYQGTKDEEERAARVSLPDVAGHNITALAMTLA